MAVNKSAGVRKAKLMPSTKKAAVKKKAATKTTAAMRKSPSKKTTTMRKAGSTRTASTRPTASTRSTTMRKAASTRTTGLKKAAPKKSSASSTSKLASKKSPPKKTTGPKLTEAQHQLLKRVVANKSASGYHTANKPEHRILETLLKHKVIKKGAKHPKTNFFHYQVSTIGKKYLQAGAVRKG